MAIVESPAPAEVVSICCIILAALLIPMSLLLPKKGRTVSPASTITSATVEEKVAEQQHSASENTDAKKDAKAELANIPDGVFALCVGDVEVSSELSSICFLGRLKSGSDAIEFLKTSKRRPDFMLVHKQTSDIGGVEVCKTVRMELNMAAEEVPVIIVAPEEPGEDDVFASVCAGANDMITHANLVSVFNSWVEATLRRDRTTQSIPWRANHFESMDALPDLGHDWRADVESLMTVSEEVLPPMELDDVLEVVVPRKSVSSGDKMTDACVKDNEQKQADHDEVRRRMVEEAALSAIRHLMSSSEETDQDGHVRS